jgi:hypothetical protein
MKGSKTVELTDKEERIFRRLLDVVSHFDLGTQPLSFVSPAAGSRIRYSFCLFYFLD